MSDDPYTGETGPARNVVAEIRARMTETERAQLDEDIAAYMREQHEYNEAGFVQCLERNLIVNLPGLARDLGTTTEDLIRSRKRGETHE